MNIAVFIDIFMHIFIFSIHFPSQSLTKITFPSTCNISSLMTHLKAHGHLSLTWHHSNHPINSWWTKSSPELHFFLFEKLFHV